MRKRSARYCIAKKIYTNQRIENSYEFCPKCDKHQRALILKSDGNSFMSYQCLTCGDITGLVDVTIHLPDRGPFRSWRIIPDE